MPMARWKIALSSALLIAACGDPASQDAGLDADRKLDAALASARKAMLEASSTDPATNRANAEALRTAAGSCRAPAGASAAQKAAFAAAASQLHRGAARLDIFAIEQLQAKQRAAVDQLLSASGASSVLTKVASVSAPSDDASAEAVAKEIESLQTEIASTEADAQTAASGVQTGQSDAADRTAQAAALERQAAAKRAAAAKARTGEAEKLIREAAALNSQAIDLRHQAETASRAAQSSGTESERLKRRLDGMQSKRKGLEEDRELHAAGAAERTKAVDQVRTIANGETERARAAAASLEKLDAELKPLFASANESLDQAASLAQQGASQGGVRMTMATVHLAQAMLQERAALGAAMEAAAFDAAGKAMSEPKWSRHADELRQERDAAGARALTALEAAEADLGADASPSIASLKTRVADAKKRFEGSKPAAKPGEGEPAASQAPASDASAAPADGAKPSEPKPDAPTADAPNPEEPKPDEPKPDEPKPEEPKADEPKPDAPPAPPGSDEPKPEPPPSQPPAR